MKLLSCIICDGEVDIINNDYNVNKKVKCRSCGFSNFESQQKAPEVLIIRKRNTE